MDKAKVPFMWQRSPCKQFLTTLRKSDRNIDVLYDIVQRGNILSQVLTWEALHNCYLCTKHLFKMNYTLFRYPQQILKVGTTVTPVLCYLHLQPIWHSLRRGSSRRNVLEKEGVTPSQMQTEEIPNGGLYTVMNLPTQLARILIFERLRIWSIVFQECCF